MRVLKGLIANKIKSLFILASLHLSLLAIFLISAIAYGVIQMYSSMLRSDGDYIITQANISDTFFSNVDTSLLGKIEQLEGVEKSSAVIVGASVVEHLPIVAIYGSSQNRFSSYTLEKGAYPKKAEALLGKGVYENLGDKKQIKIANKTFRVSGVFESDIGFENGGIVLNLEDAGALFNKSASFLLVNASLNTSKQKLEQALKGLSKEIDVKTTDAFITSYNQFKIIQTSSNLVAFLALVMGLLGVMSIMSLSIHERKSEFGIKRAIGHSMKSIVFSILAESFVLMSLAFISALTLAFVLLEFLKNLPHLQGYISGEISFLMAFSVFGISCIMALLGALMPAIKASKTDPIILIEGGA